jgi:hypothetical protein
LQKVTSLSLIVHVLLYSALVTVMAAELVHAARNQKACKPERLRLESFMVQKFKFKIIIPCTKKGICNISTKSLIQVFLLHCRFWWRWPNNVGFKFFCSLGRMPLHITRVHLTSYLLLCSSVSRNILGVRLLLLLI